MLQTSCALSSQWAHSSVDPDPKAPTMVSDDITATSGKTVSCIVI